jgi:hypothetical protein
MWTGYGLYRCDNWDYHGERHLGTTRDMQKILAGVPFDCPLEDVVQGEMNAVAV